MYDLTEEEQKEVDKVAHEVAERTRQLNVLKTEERILAEAVILLQKRGEHRLSNEVFAAMQKKGDNSLQAN